MVCQTSAMCTYKHKDYKAVQLLCMLLHTLWMLVAMPLQFQLLPFGCLLCGQCTTKM